MRWGSKTPGASTMRLYGSGTYCRLPSKRSYPSGAMMKRAAVVRPASHDAGEARDALG